MLSLMLSAIAVTHSSHGCSVCREYLKQHDEVLEIYRRHFYDLRRLILLGSPERKLLILRELLQVSWAAW